MQKKILIYIGEELAVKKLFISTILLSLLFVLAACGGHEDHTSGDTSSPSNTVELVATNWDFEKDSYTVPAGEVTIKLVNEEGYHGITIDGTDVAINGEGTATASLEPGEYQVICNVPCGDGHAEMVAQLIVE